MAVVNERARTASPKRGGPHVGAGFASTLDLAPTIYDVIAAYRLFLGRDPESFDAIRSFAEGMTLRELRATFLASPEFRSQLRPLLLRSKWVCCEFAPSRMIWIDLADKYIAYDILHGGWEPEETGFMKSRLGTGSVLLDIGANVGWFSLQALDVIGPGGRAHAFEPNPLVLPYLKRTIALNGVEDRVTIHPEALWDDSRVMNVNLRPDDFNLGHVWLGSADDKPANVTGVGTAACVRLDDILSESRVDFVKIDIEGAEAKALAGAAETIRAHRPVIMSEIYPAQLESVSGCTARHYIEKLAEMGYECWHMKGGKPVERLEDFPPDLEKELATVVFEPKPLVRSKRRNVRPRALSPLASDFASTDVPVSPL